ncbi:MAG: NAD(P)H-binding protein [Myxococcales bacterium]|nr:NAD(P)H-binding protein [Myxococcales bacterium]
MQSNAAPWAPRVLLLGATGRTGLCLLEAAREARVSVTALVRREGVLAAREGLSIVVVSRVDAASIAENLAGHTTIISAVGPPSLGPTTVCADVARAMVEAASVSRAQRLVAISSALVDRGAGLFARALASTVFRNVVRDARAMEATLLASGLPVAILRPPRLVDGERRRNLLTYPDGHPRGRHVVTRADVADYVIAHHVGSREGSMVLGLAASDTGAQRDASEEEDARRALYSLVSRATQPACR